VDETMSRHFRNLVIGVLALACCNASALSFYVATNGSDAYSGSKTRPFATLEHARDEIRRSKAAGATPKDGVTIFVREGTYRISTSLALGPQDSGTESTPVIWQAASGEKVRLSGGRMLPTDAFQPLKDEIILKRLDASVRDKVFQVDLRALGINELGNYPDIFRGAPVVPELFFNDQRLTLARWPNEGWATIAKIIDGGTTRESTNQSPRPGSFEYDGDRASRWNVETGVWLLGYWCFDWYEETIKVKAIDRDQHRIILAKPACFGIKQGNPSPRRYRVVNVLEELDQPGEYYLDRSSGRLYLWPPADMAGAQIELSTLNAPLIVLKNAEHIVIRGFTLEAGLSEGILVSGGKSNRIESCEVRNLRELGIRVEGGFGHSISDCAIHDTGTGGLALVGGDRKTLTPAGHEAVNNRIWRFSQHQFTYASGISLSGVGNRAAHNEIFDAPHMAVGISGNDHIIEFNFIHDVCTASDDSGALYKGRNPSGRGNLIRYNFWRDIGSPMGHGTAAIYFDDGDGGDTVFGNIFLRCGYPGTGGFGTVFSHGGHGNSAENNIFIECKRALGSYPWSDERWKDTLNGGQGYKWPKRLLQDVDITRPPYITHYPELVGFMNPQPGQLRVNRSKNNVLVRCGEVSSGNWTNAPGEIWLTDQNPGFVDFAKGNLQLLHDAEVFKHLPRFLPIPFENIGMQSRQLRPPKL
jgi:hypothetical protein